MAIKFPQIKKTTNTTSDPMVSLASPYAAPNANLDIDNDSDFGQYNNSKFYSPTGRIGRVKFMLYPLGFVLVGMILFGIIIMAMGGIAALASMQEGSSGGLAMVLGLMMLMIGLGVFYISIVTTVRRLNDLNRTGWLALLLFVPIIGYLLHFYLLIAKGDEGRNDYGLPAEPPSTAMKVCAFILFGLVGLGGIMAALAIPAYQQYVEKAQVAQIQANAGKNAPNQTPTAEPTQAMPAQPAQADNVTTVTTTTGQASAMPATTGEQGQIGNMEKPLMVDNTPPATSANANANTTAPSQSNANADNGVNFAQPTTDTAPDRSKDGNISYEEFTKLSEGKVYQDPVRVKK